MRIFESGPCAGCWTRAPSSSAPAATASPPCTILDKHRWLTGIEAVIDKDLASELLAHEVEADLLVIATDVDGIYLDWGKPEQRRLGWSRQRN